MNSKSISDKAIRYVENNMDERINLDSISKVMHYSKFHFHRLFLSEMGISVIDYIRMRRVSTSSHILRTTELSITAIALRKGFNNVDTYIKNFKSYYGITPGQYRIINIKPIEGYTKECNYKMNNKYEAIRNCSKEDKNNALYMLDRMLELSNIAHQNGLLSLENELRNDDSKFLKKSIELLLKGTDCNELKNILSTYIISTDLSAYELLLRVLILEGTMLLQEGSYPWNVRINLSSYFGEDFIEVLDDKYNYMGDLNSFIHSQVVEINDNNLIKEIEKMNARILQRVFRECDIIIIAISLMGMKKVTKEIVINSLPLGQRRILAEVVTFLNKINPKHIIDANNEIISVIQSLRLSKDI